MKAPKWPALKDGLQAFSRVAVKTLQDLVNGGTVLPVHSETVPVRCGANQWSFETKESPLVGVLLVKQDKNLKALSEYQRCESILLKEKETASHMNQLVGTPHHSAFMNVDRMLYAILLDQLAGGSLEFREDRFEQTYEKVEEYFSSKSERFVGWVPLKNFTSDLDEIVIGPGLAIKRLSDAVIAEFYTYGGSGAFGGINEVLGWTHGIFVEYELPKIFGGIVKPAEESLDPLRAAFERPVEEVIRSLG